MCLVAASQERTSRCGTAFLESIQARGYHAAILETREEAMHQGRATGGLRGGSFHPRIAEPPIVSLCRWHRAMAGGAETKMAVVGDRRKDESRMTKGSILIVDDEPIVREAIRDWMVDAGYSVTTANAPRHPGIAPSTTDSRHACHPP